MEIFGLHPTLVYAIGNVFWIGVTLWGLTMVIAAVLNRDPP